MCDHCSKVTTQKGYTGQVTCRCEHPEKKVEERGKDVEGATSRGGCCSTKPKESSKGCCQSSCCKDSERREFEASQLKKDSGGGCCKYRK